MSGDNKAYVLKPSLEFDLQVPIKVKGVETQRLTLRRANWGDLKVAQAQSKGDQAEMAKILLCNLAGMSPAEFDELDLFDACSLLEMSSGFLYGGKNFQMMNRII